VGGQGVATRSSGRQGTSQGIETISVHRAGPSAWSARVTGEHTTALQELRSYRGYPFAGSWMPNCQRAQLYEPRKQA